MPMPPKSTPDGQERKARDWADAIPDEDEPASDAYEPTYRDGSLKNECWNDSFWRNDG